MSKSLEELSSLYELQNQIEKLLVLKATEKPHYKRMVETLQGFSFLSHMVYLVELHYILFAHYFNSEGFLLLSLLQNRELHFSECSYSQGLQQVEIFYRKLLLRSFLFVLLRYFIKNFHYK